MPPYGISREEDELHWSRLIKNLSARYALTRRDIVFNIRDEILAATGGVVGEAIQLLERAHGRAADDGRELVTLQDIRASYHSDSDLVALWSDIDEFERVMKTSDVKERADSIKDAWSKQGKTLSNGPKDASP